MVSFRCFMFILLQNIKVNEHIQLYSIFIHRVKKCTICAGSEKSIQNNMRTSVTNAKPYTVRNVKAKGSRATFHSTRPILISHFISLLSAIQLINRISLRRRGCSHIQLPPSPSIPSFLPVHPFTDIISICRVHNAQAFMDGSHYHHHLIFALHHIFYTNLHDCYHFFIEKYY